ncbi:putative alpha/Beta hydrolase [Helianthus debilis subsp. tardiflorus]
MKFFVGVRSFIKQTNTNELPAKWFMNCSLKIRFVCSPTYFCFYVKLGVGGFKFSMGAATALYSASCFTHGKFRNGNAYSTHLDAVVGLSGWLLCAKDLSKKIKGEEAANHASSLPILLCHGKDIIMGSVLGIIGSTRKENGLGMLTFVS